MKSAKGKQIKVISGFPFVPDLIPCLHVSPPTVVGGFSPLRQKLFLEPPNSHYLSKIKLLKISTLSAKKIIIGSCIARNVLTAVMFR